VHTVAAGYVTASMFVLGISSWYMLKGRDLAFAKRSFSVAIGFGLAGILSVILLGDESGYEVGDVQKVKLAAIEAEWHSEPAPAGFTIIGFPSNEDEETHGAIKIPWLLGLIATRSLDTEVKGLKDLMVDHEIRIRSGMIAYDYLQRLRGDQDTPENRAVFEDHKDDLGYGLLLKRYTDDPSQSHRGADPHGGQGLDPRGRTALLELPGDGRGRILDAGPDAPGLLLQRQTRHPRETLAAAALPLEHPGALDRGGDRLVRGRVRPSALGDRRGPADQHRGLEPGTERPHHQSLGLHPLLHGALDHRDVSDVQVRPAGTQLAAYGPLPPRRGGHGVPLDHRRRPGTRARTAETARLGDRS
jgi:hypothetical protein